ncbi:MAG: DNA methylase [Bacteroidales bacterium]|nr:DNA methylase [Bacteroidales bacterium]
MEKTRLYAAIDLKSFYASCECVERGLDPLDTNLVVADASRTEKTIGLALSPPLKAYGLGGRSRLFEISQRIGQVNRERLCRIPSRRFSGKSCSESELAAHPDWEVGYIVAPPRMAHYIEFSTRIYQIYLKYVAPESLLVYSIDEVFIDLTDYLPSLKMTAHGMAMAMIRDVLRQTGITATAGIGTNMYLAKVAMDIVAKKMPADSDGVRIAELDEVAYRRELWGHQPLTDFWRVGRGTSDRLAQYGLRTMGDIARASLTNEDFLYKLFGINAELLIDHAWGWEPTTMEAAKNYRPETHSLSSGQVLQSPYEIPKTRIVAEEMAEALAMELLEKGLVTDQLVLTIGYDVDSLRNPVIREGYHGPVTTDRYGRTVPRHSQGTANLPFQTCSARMIKEAVLGLFDAIANPALLTRRLTIAANRVEPEAQAKHLERKAEINLFTDVKALERELQAEHESLAKERRAMEAQLALKKRFGKNAILKGLNFQEGATQRERNGQIGGHKA